MIKNIVFDMGGVLIVWDPVRMLNQLHLSEADNELLNRELLQNPIWTEADAGLYTEEQLAQTACAHLPERLHQAAWALVQWYKWFLTPMPGMAALVRELKENGYRIYLLSNAETNLRGYFPGIPGSECFDALMVSAEEGLMKPSQDIYQRLFQKFDLKPASAGLPMTMPPMWKLPSGQECRQPNLTAMWGCCAAGCGQREFAARRNCDDPGRTERENGCSRVCV